MLSLNPKKWFSSPNHKANFLHVSQIYSVATVAILQQREWVSLIERGIAEIIKRPSEVVILLLYKMILHQHKLNGNNCNEKNLAFERGGCSTAILWRAHAGFGRHILTVHSVLLCLHLFCYCIVDIDLKTNFNFNLLKLGYYPLQFKITMQAGSESRYSNNGPI